MSHPLPKTYLRIHAPHTHTCTTKNICQDTCTTYTYMHHQIPPENKICLVDLTSVLYERPNQNERFLLNNMFLVLFSEMCSLWNAQCISVKCAALFTEMHKLTEMRKLTWKAQCISLKCAALFSNISWAFGFPPSIGLSYERPIRTLRVRAGCTLHPWIRQYIYKKYIYFKNNTIIIVRTIWINNFCFTWFQLNSVIETWSWLHVKVSTFDVALFSLSFLWMKDLTWSYA